MEDKKEFMCALFEEASNNTGYNIPEENRKESFQQIKPKMGNQEELCLEYINNGYRDWESIEDASGMNHDSCKRAVTMLHQKELIKPIGKKLSRNNRNITVYVAV